MSYGTTGMSYDDHEPTGDRPRRGRRPTPRAHHARPRPAEPLRPGDALRPHVGHHGDLRRLRRAYRRQRRVTTLAALGYFALFVALSANAPNLMARPLVGDVPTGLALALSHVPVTWLAVALYEHTARRFVDPLARRVNHRAPWAAEGAGADR